MSISLTDQAAETCPDCSGKGRVRAEVNMPGRGKYATAIIPVECKTCSGEGWVEIEESEVE